MWHSKVLIWGVLVFLICTLEACTGTKSGISPNPGDNGVVDIGYGKIRQAESTQSVSVVKTPHAHLSLENYLRRVPGLHVTGQGANAKVNIRGAQSSVGISSEPLFILNGSPVGNNFNRIADLVDVYDIESVTVLKDVASTSIYGSRGEHGVVLIRTKGSR